MPRLDRYTTRRGRCAVPCTLPRTRLCRRVRASLTVRLGTFPDLSAYVFAVVADALALVRFRRANLADLGRRLPDLLFVGALDDDLRRRRDLERDACARLDRDGVRVADAELEIGALERGAVADALDLQALLESLRDAFDHVRDERPRQAVQRTVLAALGRAHDRDRPVGLLDRHTRGDLLLERAERARDRDAAGLHRHGDAGGDFDGLSSDTTHVLTR